jgi:hypothetical protein
MAGDPTGNAVKFKRRLGGGAEACLARHGPRRCGRAGAAGPVIGCRLDRLYPVALASVAGGARECGARAGTRLPRAGAASSLMISLFVEYQQLIGCQNSVIMGRPRRRRDNPDGTSARGPGQEGRERLTDGH